MSTLPQSFTPADKLNLPDVAGVGFPACRLLSGSTLWVSPDYVPPEADRDSDRHQAFFDRFAWAIPGTRGMEDLRLDGNHVRTLWAERYGGRGIGDNGGGARVGNGFGYQIKGVGRNQLVGGGHDFIHSYGGLTAVEAIYETIYANLLNKIMPLGAARVYGIIITGPKAAYWRFQNETPEAETESWKAWGALLVREICRRPAHFLRTRGFSPVKRPGSRIAPDVARVRAASKALFRESGSASGFIMFLGEFLQNCASQFAFARVARLAHGSLTPSNLCLDGRWIDLARTTFIPAGQNNGFFIPSNDEFKYVLDVLRELADMVGKFNELDLNIPMLMPYYTEQYAAHLDVYLCYLLGIQHERISDAGVAAYEQLAGQLKCVLNHTPARIIATPAALAPHDPVIGLMEALFLSSTDRARSRRIAAACIGAPEFDLDSATSAFDAVMQDVFHHPDNPVRDHTAFLIAAAVTALRPALLHEFFYKKRLDNDLKKVTLESSSDGFADIIRVSEDIVDWGFSRDVAPMVWLFRGNGIQIFIDISAKAYCLHSASTRKFQTAADLAAALADLPDSALTLSRYSFRPYLLRLLSVIATLEENYV